MPRGRGPDCLESVVFLILVFLIVQGGCGEVGSCGGKGYPVCVVGDVVHLCWRMSCGEVPVGVTWLHIHHLGPASWAWSGGIGGVGLGT